MKNSDSTKLLSRFTILVGLFTTCCTGAIVDQQQDETSKDKASKLLVSPDWLADQIKSNSNLRIIDLPMRKTNYETGHVPGAVFLDWRTDIIDSEQHHLYRLPKKEVMEKLLSRLGVNSSTTIVLTDNMLNRTAVRMYYTLKYFGHKDVRILNGGTKVWADSKRELSKEVPEFEATKYRILTTNDDYEVKLEAVKQAIENEDCQLIDGRPNDQYTGEAPGKAFHTNKEHARYGHVPSAASIPWKTNLNEDGTFKSVKELQKLYKSHGIDTDGEVITYCNEGLHAAMPWFIIKELFGNSDVTVYDNSMVEWANRDDTPLEKSK